MRTHERKAAIFEAALDEMEIGLRRRDERIRMLESALDRLDKRGGLGAETHEQIRALLELRL